MKEHVVDHYPQPVHDAFAIACRAVSDLTDADEEPAELAALVAPLESLGRTYEVRELEQVGNDPVDLLCDVVADRIEVSASVARIVPEDRSAQLWVHELARLAHACLDEVETIRPGVTAPNPLPVSGPPDPASRLDGGPPRTAGSVPAASSSAAPEPSGGWTSASGHQRPDQPAGAVRQVAAGVGAGLIRVLGTVLGAVVGLLLWPLAATAAGFGPQAPFAPGPGGLTTVELWWVWLVCTAAGGWGGFVLAAGVADRLR